MRKPIFSAVGTGFKYAKVDGAYVNTITYSYKNGRWIIKTSYEPIGYETNKIH